MKAESKTEELWNNRAYKAFRDLGKAQSDTPDCLLLSNILDRSSVTDSAVTRAPSSYSDIFCHWHVTDHVEKLGGLYEDGNTKEHLLECFLPLNKRASCPGTPDLSQ